MIKIFVGCAANGEDIESQIVLEHSLRKYCSRDISITWMKLSRDPDSFFYGWRSDKWSTPFSAFRWAVPELCNFEGRGLYLDSDIICRADIAELWNTPIDLGKIVIAKGGGQSWRYCVSVWDCAAARKYLPAVSYLKNNPDGHNELVAMMRQRRDLVQPFSNGNWNCIDGEDYLTINDPDIKMLHYSSEAHQPQLRHAIPRLAKKGLKHWFDGDIKRHWQPSIEALFDKELDEALAEGYKIEDYEPQVMYGEYIKASMKNYRSHQWAK